MNEPSMMNASSITDPYIGFGFYNGSLWIKGNRVLATKYIVLIAIIIAIIWYKKSH